MVMFILVRLVMVAASLDPKLVTCNAELRASSK